jgi:rhodanese-related sulfurtransferase
MISTLKKILGIGPATDWAALAAAGAQIIDVRSNSEFACGHINNAVNIPLDRLQAHLHKIRKDKVVITCCASGMRSASAKAILMANGFSEVYNGGGWTSLQSKIS